jgi:hypothetical protein
VNRSGSAVVERIERGRCPMVSLAAVGVVVAALVMALLERRGSVGSVAKGRVSVELDARDLGTERWALSEDRALAYEREAVAHDARERW